MAESNRMKEMPVNKLMVQMGIPMILSMALQAVYNIVDSAFVGNMNISNTQSLREAFMSDIPTKLNRMVWTNVGWILAGQGAFSVRRKRWQMKFVKR